MVILVVLGILLGVYTYAGAPWDRAGKMTFRSIFFPRSEIASRDGRGRRDSRDGRDQRVPRSRRKRDSPPSFDAGLLAVEVAARIDSGADHRRAWLTALARFEQSADSSGAGATSEMRGDHAGQIDEVGVPLLLRELWERAPRNPRRARGLLGIPALIAVCRLTHHTGASAARILENCAAALSESSDALGERRIALAGPRSAVKMLAAMPLFGMLLGSFFGGNPVTFLVETPIGRCCFALALICEVAGIVWMRRLVRKAEQWG